MAKLWPLFISVIALICSCSSDNESTADNEATEQESSNEEASLTAYESEILALINTHRQDNGLQVLSFNSVIQAEAKAHSINMATEVTAFGHDDFETRKLNIERKLGNINAVAENVAFGQYPAQKVVNSWLNSSGHRRNIEGSYNLTGISAQQSADGDWFYTQIFANK